MNELEIFIDGLLTEGGISPATAPYIRLLILLVMLGIIAGVAFWITKAIVISSLYKVFRRTRITWDDALVEYKVFNNVAHIIPAAITRIFAQIIFRDFEQLVPLVIKVTDSYLIIVGVSIIISFVRVAEYALSKSAVFADKPIASYFQLIRIIIYIGTGILVLSVLLGGCGV